MIHLQNFWTQNIWGQNLCSITVQLAGAEPGSAAQTLATGFTQTFSLVAEKDPVSAP